MYPEILHVSFLHTYGVLVAVPFLAGLAITTHLGKRGGLSADAVTNLAVYCALAAIVGAKLMMFLVDFRHYTDHPGEILSATTLAYPRAAPDRRHHQLVSGALLDGALRRGILPLSRTGKSLEWSTGYVSMDFHSAIRVR